MMQLPMNSMRRPHFALKTVLLFRLGLSVLLAVPLFFIFMPESAHAQTPTFGVSGVPNKIKFINGDTLLITGKTYYIIAPNVPNQPVANAQVTVTINPGSHSIGTVNSNSGGDYTISSAALTGYTDGNYTIAISASAPLPSQYSSTTTSLAVPITFGAVAASSSTPTKPGGGTIPAGNEVSIPNPITCGDATCLVGQVIKYILGVIAIIATLMFIWGGVMMLTSGGNAEQVKKARETLVWATIGIIVILLSWAIIRFVLTGLVGVSKK